MWPSVEKFLHTPALNYANLQYSCFVSCVVSNQGCGAGGAAGAKRILDRWSRSQNILDGGAGA